jgi:NAD(P)H-flavin reductase
MPPRVHLFFGARTGYDLYDLAGLDKMAARYDWLTVTSAVSDDPHFPGQRGTVAEVATSYGTWTDRDAYVCGSSAMVAASVSQLRSLGMPEQQIHVEDFGWSWGEQ